LVFNKLSKSTLINGIFEEVLTQEGEVSHKNKKGKNTTTSTKLYKVEENTYIADTPGFGIMDLDMEELDLAHSFVEFFELSSNCKYNGCLHLNEPNCAVKKALEKGEILSTRYENYKQFIEEIRKRKKW